MCPCLITQPNILLKKYDFCSFCSFYRYYCFSFFFHFFALCYSFVFNFLFAYPFSFSKTFPETFSRTIHLANFTENFFLDVTFDKLEFCWDLRAVAWDFLISFLIHTDRHFLERLLSVLLENLFLRGCFYVCINLLLIVIFLKIFGDLVRSAN